MNNFIPVLLLICSACRLPAQPLSVFVFTLTGGVRHESIPAGIAALQEMGTEHGFTVVHSEDLNDINIDYLSQFSTLVWLNTTGNIFSVQHKEALQDYIMAGGGWVGLHGAANFEGGVRWNDWDWFGGLLGGSAWYHSNPWPDYYTDSRCVNERPDHPAVSHFASDFYYLSEYFNFVNNPRNDPDVTVLVSVDETSYDPGDGAMGDHPAVWSKEYDGGRSLYTTWGHGIDEYGRPEFREFLLGAIYWTSGVEKPTGIEPGNGVRTNGTGNGISVRLNGINIGIVLPGKSPAGAPVFDMAGRYFNRSPASASFRFPGINYSEAEAGGTW